MLRFSSIIAGKLIKRYQRFFMDVLVDGKVITAHVPNTGSLLGLLNEGSDVLLSKNDDPKRKLSYTVEAISFNNLWVGINTQIPNKLIKQEFLSFQRKLESSESAERLDASLRWQDKAHLFYDLHHYKNIYTEKTYGINDRSRIDLLLSDSVKKEPDIYIEIKNVTLMRDNIAYFPDAKTLRGQKHIEDLMHVKAQGFLAMLIFLVQRMDCDSFSLAKDIDPIYAEKLEGAMKEGLRIKVIRAKVDEQGICLENEIGCLL